jgi:hypothetical protein
MRSQALQTAQYKYYLKIKDSPEFREHQKIYQKKYRKTHQQPLKKYVQTHKKQIYERNKISMKKLSRSKKVRAVEYLGGKCSICGYNKCMAALDFHHKNGDDKYMSIGKLLIRSWDTIQKELDKCVLLCANCHREIRYLKEI